MPRRKRFRDQRVGEDELGLRHVLDPKSDIGGFAGCGVVAMDDDAVAVERADGAAEAAAAIERNIHLDLHQMSGVALEIRAAHQRTVHARRGNFQPIGAVHGIGHIENRRERARNRLAILHRHAAVRPLGHDLHRAALRAGDAHAHEAVAEPFDHRLGDAGDARGHTRLGDETGIGGKMSVRRSVHATGLLSSLPG